MVANRKQTNKKKKQIKLATKKHKTNKKVLSIKKIIITGPDKQQVILILKKKMHSPIFLISLKFFNGSKLNPFHPYLFIHQKIRRVFGFRHPLHQRAFIIQHKQALLLNKNPIT